MPSAHTRLEVRQLIERYGRFIEVHVATQQEVCEQRDHKGLYAKARAGLIKEFTGIDHPYEAPERAEVTIDTTRTIVDEAAKSCLYGNLL